MGKHLEAFEKFKHRATEIKGVDKVYLFGSVARGSHGVESDVDIFVKGVEDLRPELEEIGFEISLEEDVSVTVIVEDSMDSRLGREVLEKGVTHVRS